MFEPYNARPIVYREKKIAVYGIKGLPDSIRIGHDGKIYFSWWASDVPLDSPQKRREKSWLSEEKRWRQYTDMFALFRGLDETVTRTVEGAIPTVEAFRHEFREVDVELIGLREMTDNEITGLKQQLNRLGELLEPKQAEPLKEARQQIVCCIPLRDSLDRINVGSLRCRVNTGSRRLHERLTEIYAWLTHYGAWRQAVANFGENQRHYLADLQNQLRVLNNLLPDKQRTDHRPPTKAVVLARLQETSRWLENLKLVGGFINWATHTLTDIYGLADQIEGRQWRKARATISRLSNAAELKWGQFRLNALVLTVATDQLKQIWRPAEYRATIDSLVTQVKKVDETGFEQPVGAKIIAHLNTADVFLSSRPADGSTEQFKAALRNAMSLF